MKSLIATLASSVRKSDQMVRINEVEDISLHFLTSWVLVDSARCGKQLAPWYVNDGILALKQYYVISMLDPDNNHPIPSKLDDFWCAHISHTEVYQAFCNKIFGHYLHREPLSDKDSEGIDRACMLYGRTVVLLNEVFGRINPMFWPKKAMHNKSIKISASN